MKEREIVDDGKLRCKNCGHLLEKMDKDTTFLKKYKTLRNGLCHRNNVWYKQNPSCGISPSRACGVRGCGCKKPEILEEPQG